jgi:hypothetical protein
MSDVTGMDENSAVVASMVEVRMKASTFLRSFVDEMTRLRQLEGISKLILMMKFGVFWHDFEDFFVLILKFYLTHHWHTCTTLLTLALSSSEKMSMSTSSGRWVMTGWFGMITRDCCVMSSAYRGVKVSWEKNL